MHRAMGAKSRRIKAEPSQAMMRNKGYGPFVSAACCYGYKEGRYSVPSSLDGLVLIFSGTG